jgi:pimeloyl-ACP methyl ester carboxylesterase
LLLAAQIHGPVVYVGHSIAGLYGIYLAAVYPRDVAGAVFVDPAFPNVFDKLVDALPATVRPQEYAIFAQMIAAQQLCTGLARTGALMPAVTANAKACIDPASYPDTLDAKLKTTLTLQMAAVQENEAMLSLQEGAFSVSQRPSQYDLQIDSVHPDFGNKPLIVLTEGSGEPLPAPNPAAQAAMTAVWRAGHRELAQTSTLGSDIIVPHTGHFIQIEQPSAVIDAIKQTVLLLRRQA